MNETQRFLWPPEGGLEGIWAESQVGGHEAGLARRQVTAAEARVDRWQMWQIERVQFTSER